MNELSITWVHQDGDDWYAVATSGRYAFASCAHASEEAAKRAVLRLARRQLAWINEYEAMEAERCKVTV